MAPKDQIDIIMARVAENKNINKHKIQLTCSKEMGEHYIGELVPVTLTGKKSEQTFKLNVIVKVPQRRENNAEVYQDMFQREIFAYSALLPTYVILQQNVEESLRMTMIKCYFQCSDTNSEALVLHDMRPEGYNIYIESMTLDFNHLQLAIKEMAKFHALSFVLQNQQPELFIKYTKNCTPFMENEAIRSPFVDMVKSSLTKHLSFMTNLEQRDKLKRYEDSWIESAMVKNGQVRVICHNDIWRNNILFKYEGAKPVSACLLDYQLIQYVNPALDLLNFITGCSNHETRRYHYDNLLRLYHGTIAKILSNFSLNIEDIFSFEDLVRDLKHAASYCLVKGIFSFQTWYGIGGMHDSSDFGKSDNDKAVEGVNEKDAMREYLDVVNCVISDYIKYEYI